MFLFVHVYTGTNYSYNSSDNNSLLLLGVDPC